MFYVLSSLDFQTFSGFIWTAERFPSYIQPAWFVSVAVITRTVTNLIKCNLITIKL